MDKDKLARSAASQWSYCHKCDGVVNETGMRCDKNTMHTCRKWYDGYRTAMIALGEAIKDEPELTGLEEVLAMIIHIARKQLEAEKQRKPSPALTRIIESLTPEKLEQTKKEMLEETDDEMIRKEIISALKFANDDGVYDKHIAYLEKQKELFESGRGLYYYDGEKTTYCGCPATEDNPYDFAMSQQEKQKELSAEEYANVIADEEVQGLSIGGKHIPAIKKLIRRAFRFGVKWGREKELPTNEEMLRTLRTEYEKGVADTIAKYEQKEPKPEWSEEDEEMLNIALQCLVGTPYSQGTKDKVFHWLKSLKNRGNFPKSNTNSPSWKPSEGQMKALKEAVDMHWEPDGLDPLYSLYEHLKKLI